MDTPVIVSLIGAVLALSLFCLKNYFDLRTARRNSAANFFAKVDECLADIKHGNEKSEACVCHQSYACFRLTLRPGQAKELDECWSDYIDTKCSRENTKESLECLKQCVHDLTGT